MQTKTKANLQSSHVIVRQNDLSSFAETKQMLALWTRVSDTPLADRDEKANTDGRRKRD